MLKYYRSFFFPSIHNNGNVNENLIYKSELEDVESECNAHRAAVVGESPLRIVLLGGGDLPKSFALSGRKKFDRLLPPQISDRILLFDIDKLDNRLLRRQSTLVEPILPHSVSLELEES